MTATPMTLGEKLAPIPPKRSAPSLGLRLRIAVYMMLHLALLSAIWALVAWWLVMRPSADVNVMLGLLAALIVLWWVSLLKWRATKTRKDPVRHRQHLLLANDRQGFMHALLLDAKTVILDGNNIYHFGHANGLDAHPLGAIVNRLREEGYRVVCFFDANIYYTLSEHGAFAADEQHSIALLKDIFGLCADEIYIVPSGVQADRYILESLKHLPVSFAVTNDRFRDYAKDYPTVMKGNQWRKGVAISKNEIKLLKHRFQTPIPLA